MDLSQFLPQFGNLAFTVIAFVVALSVIVAVHEYGHYIVGRWSGIKAEVFSLGFGPVLVSRTDRHGTRWQIAALPFGGFVKFLGDANAASLGGDEAHVPRGERRHTMLGAPLWARVATVLAGPGFNFILAFLVFAGVILTQGRAADPARIASLIDLPPGITSDLRPGDEVLAVGGLPVTTQNGYFEIADEASLTVAAPLWTVRRDGQEIEVPGPHPQPPVVGGVNPNSAAWDAGLMPGDVILSVDGQPLSRFVDLVDRVVTSDGAEMVLEIWRDGAVQTVTVAPRRQDLPLPEGGFETRWLLGVAGGSVLTIETQTPGLAETARTAVWQIWYIITSSLSGLWHVLTGAISTCNLSGPVGIAETSGAMASQGTVSFIWFIGVLSAAVGLLNLFPVPMLDGGHLVFYVWEGLSGRPPSDRALRVLMAAGLSVILTLTLFALANDLFLCP